VAVTYDLTGRVALVTGAGRGIGFETARQLAQRGASVVLADLDSGQLEEAARAIGERAAPVTADVRDQAQVDAAVAEAVERFGGLDVAVANAGIAPKRVGTVRTGDPDLWETIVDVNLMGVWRTVRAALPHVVERKGQLVLVASVYAFMNGVSNSAYATAKAGVESLGRSLRTELAPHGASASVAYFGFIDTRMVQDAFEDPVAKRFEGTFPSFVTRRSTPDRAAAAVVDGIESRAPRIVHPGWWKAVSALRGVVNPLLDRRMERDPQMREFLRQAEDPSRPAGGPATG
jgi:NAD(P)-dependent dehydrogenase (short-subunit alcohol dehydrogenase family)